MANRVQSIDNKSPTDPRYPAFRPPITAYRPNGVNCIARTGDYIINRDGMIMIVTSGNDRWASTNRYLRDMNEACLRAKYIGSEDDCLEMANQMRRATDAEIAKTKRYVRQTEFVF